jgi:hypothetical protein
MTAQADQRSTAPVNKLTEPIERVLKDAAQRETSDH